MSEQRRLRRASARQQAAHRVRQAVAQRRAGHAKPLRERAKGWLTGKRPLALAGVIFISLLIAAPTVLPQLTSSAAPLPTPGAETPVATPTPDKGSLSAPEMRLVEGTTYRASLATPRGTIRFELLTQDVPMAANNLVALARNRFYQGTKVYRVESGAYVALGALNDDGTGTPGYTLNPDETRRQAVPGSVAFALQDGMVSSQLLIVTGDGPVDVPHLVVGRVTDGLDIARELKVGDQVNSLTITESR